MRLRVNGLIDTQKMPREAGKDFAQKMLNAQIKWENLSIQLTGVPASILICSFWDGFKQEIKKTAPALWENILSIEWICDHEFQEENVKKWLINV